MNKERKEYSITWFIENYSYCWQKTGEVLRSPEFTIDGLEGTTWNLEIYPRGNTDKETGKISLFLTRKKCDSGPEEFPLTYEVSVLSADGSILRSSKCDHAFKSGVGYGPSNIAMLEDVFLLRKSDYLFNDTLNVRCKIRRDEDNIQPVTQITARTRIGIAQVTFLHTVEGFSSLEPNQKKTIQIKSPSKKGLDLSSSLYFSDDPCCEGKIIVEIVPSTANEILTKCKISLFDSFGKAIECAEVDNRFDIERKDIKKLPLSLTRQAILKRKSDYLQDDKLCLMCECVFSTGVEFEKIERILYDLPFVPLDQTRAIEKDMFAEKLSECPSALDDFKEIYNNRLLSDVELKTKTKAFPAHKIVLCARSSVFKSMLTSDMKEKNTDCIQLDDLDDDTVQQLLLFLYSDEIESLKWESVIKLYYTADKYAIEKLKLMCSSFLVKALTTSSASELLLLADTHNDSLLKKLVEDFIFKHEEDVFGLYEWLKLIKTNPLLVSETMCLKYKRKP